MCTVLQTSKGEATMQDDKEIRKRLLSRKYAARQACGARRRAVQVYGYSRQSVSLCIFDIERRVVLK